MSSTEKEADARQPPFTLFQLLIDNFHEHTDSRLKDSIRKIVFRIVQGGLGKTRT